MGAKQTFQEVATETQEILSYEKNKADWLRRYRGYADKISANLDSIRNNRRRFHAWSPLTFYLNTSNAQGAKKNVTLGVRYLGQTVAELTSNKDGVTLSTKPSKVRTNKRDFGCTDEMKNVPWTGKEARKFRAHFKNREPVRNKTDDNKGNEEHRLESLLLSKFAESESTNKALPNIKPVMIEGLFFPMPTPLSAANHGKIKYSGKSRGGIDIFARVGTGGRATYLCVIELKDENTQEEPATDTLEQAIAYTVFIRELLRSKIGPGWWKLFGFGGIIPKKLVLHSVCAMPDVGKIETSFAGEKICIGEDEIHLHYIYFKESENKIEITRTSLSYGKQASVSQ